MFIFLPFCFYLFSSNFRVLSVMSRHKKHGRQQPEEEGLLVFGYSSRIYPNDSRSELIAGESHLQPWPMDESVLIDRFDVRLLLSTLPSESREKVEDDKEERECEDERWRDLHDAELASLKRMEDEEVEMEARPKKAEYAFTYDQPSFASTPPSSSKVEEKDDDSEDEPFVPPSGIKLPLGLETPDNQKLNHVIERTAVFVVKQGPQMEIVIKAKQRTNQEQFGFLHFDHLLNPYYKYIMKLIREGKYTPNLEPKKNKSVTNGTSQKENDNGSNGKGKTSGNALTALMAQHGSDSESDSDCELHPSLLARSRRGDSPDPVEKGVKSFAGPQKKPVTPPPKVMRSDYRLETANDTYSTLFKNLAQINVQREKDQEEVERAERGDEKKEIEENPIQKEEESEESKKEWEDFTDWFISFYGMSPPLPFCNMPYIPPPPDIEQALAGYARYVGENGPEAEFALKGRVELQLHFLTPSNPHHLYYLSAVRRAQWEKNQKDQRDNDEAMSNAVVPPPPPLNRKQRRMAFMDAPLVSTTALPSIIDPTALLLASAALPHSYETPMVKSASSPILHSTVTSSPSYSYSSPRPMSPAPPAPPLSHVASSEGDVNCGLTLLPCPVPPNISTLAASQIAKPMEIMTERQLKARLFMEKILNDKRKKKEEEITKGVEGMEEGEILESEEKEGRRGRREGRGNREVKKDKERKDEKGEKKTVSASFFDDLIKSKMNELLKETVPGSLAVEKKNEEIKESKRVEDEKEKEKEKKGKDDKRGKDKKEEKREKEREERKRKREKKEKKRRSRSRSSSSDERRRRRRRSRSASSELPSKYRRR